MRRSISLLSALAPVLVGLWCASAQALDTTILHSFGGPSDGGGAPIGTLTLDGSSLYGSACVGGAGGKGTLFSLGTDGSGFTVLHSFAGGLLDGEYPTGPLTLRGSILYGMSTYGGSDNRGTVFSIGTDGSGFKILHSFGPGVANGVFPYLGLTIAGSTLFGMTYQGGGGNGYGTLFSMDTDGNSFRLLHTFTAGTNDGRLPQGGLTISGSTLYGMTATGGAGNAGTVFSINTDGTGFALIHSFTGRFDDGAGPWGNVTVDGSTLYGMTFLSSDPELGTRTKGTIFSVGTDGTGFKALHSFTGSATDGGSPFGSLILNGTTLYGTTSAGGSEKAGTLFSIETDGTSFNILHSFSYFDDGYTPTTDVVLDGSILYGITGWGGSYGSGTVFSLTVPEPSNLALLGMGALGLAHAWRRRKR